MSSGYLHMCVHAFISMGIFCVCHLYAFSMLICTVMLIGNIKHVVGDTIPSHSCTTSQFTVLECIYVC